MEYVVKKDDSLFKHTALGKREIIFDGLVGSKPSILTISISDECVCTFNSSPWNIKSLDVVILYINDEKKYCVLMAINNESLTFKSFDKVGEARSFAKQYSDLL